MSNATHLLVVDDDAELQDLLRRYFVREGFEISIAGNGAGMREALARNPVDLVLLDLGLPGEDGFALTRQLRESWNGAVIIITGRGESVDRVVGLELGADDYVTKPFDLRELLARVRSVLRRSAAARQREQGQDDAPFHFAGFRLDPLTRTLRDAAGKDVPLTSGEFDLLRALLDQPNRVLSRDDLMDRIHGRSAGPYDRSIDVQIGRLRRKIEAEPAQPELIKSVRGAGYLFTPRIRRGDE
ncbi:MAG TPA: response regulator [Rhodanobacteraceae bacterium]